MRFTRVLARYAIPLSSNLSNPHIPHMKATHHTIPSHRAGDLIRWDFESFQKYCHRASNGPMPTIRLRVELMRWVDGWHHHPALGYRDMFICINSIHPSTLYTSAAVDDLIFPMPRIFLVIAITHSNKKFLYLHKGTTDIIIIIVWEWLLTAEDDGWLT